jgi:phosphatidylserine decarboxylase
MCQEYRCFLCSLWVVMYICVRNIDVVSVPCEWSCIWENIDIPDTYIHDHSQGTETTSIFLIDIYTWPLTRNRENIDIPDRHAGISMLSLFLKSGHVYVCQDYRCCLCSLWVVIYMSVRNIDVVSVPCEWSCICLSGISMLSDIYTWPLTRNRENIDIPDRPIHDHSQGTETTSIFLTNMYMTTHKEQRLHRYFDVVFVPCEWSCICVSGISMLSLFLVSGHVYVCQEYRWTETTSIFLIHIYMTTHKEQRQHRYSWHIYTWPLTRNRDNIDIPDTYIHDHSQGTETTSIFLTHIYMTTHKEQRQRSLCSLWVVMYICVRNIDVVFVPCEWSCICVSGISMFHSQGTETTSIFLTHIYMTTHKEQRLHRYSWQTCTWPLTRNRDNIYIPDIYIHV